MKSFHPKKGYKYDAIIYVFSIIQNAYILQAISVQPCKISASLLLGQNSMAVIDMTNSVRYFAT